MHIFTCTTLNLIQNYIVMYNFNCHGAINDITKGKGHQIKMINSLRASQLNISNH